MTSSIDDRLRDIASRLQLDRPLCFLDLETTGTSVDNDRIVEIATATVRPDGGIERYRSLVNPGLPIPREASAIHGISDDDVRSAPTFRTLAPKIAADLGGVDLAGFNLVGFDLRLLNAEFRRVAVAFDPIARRVVDAMAIFHQNEKRDLEAAVRFYCQRPHHGHRAEADVDATIDVLAAQLLRYQQLPAGVAALDAYCSRRKPGWLTSDGKVEWKEGAARITFGKHSGQSLVLLAKNEPDYLRWILAKDFADDLKKLASEALAGRFPTAPRAAGD